MMHNVTVAAVVVACSTILIPQTVPAADPPPNVIFIMADDLGYAELGCYGQEKIRTPHLDQLAADGMRFTQHYCGNPVCATSRCVLMTGKHSGHAFIRDNREVQPEGQYPIPDAEVTIAELFHQAGYATGAMGKWGLGPPASTGDPLRQGFDHFFGYNCQRHAHNYYPRYLWDDDQHINLEGNDRGLTGAQYAPDFCTERELAFIRDNKDHPFFLYVPTIVPHLAIQVPEDSLAEYRGLWDDPPYEGGHGYLPHPAPRAGYAAMVTRMDRDVGRILDLLDELGLSERTIVVFTSDNGPTYDRLGGSDSEFFHSAGPLRGLKGSIYEGGIRVPMIARWPGRIPAGTTSDFASAFYDWMPTLMDLIGKPELTPSDSDGISIAPTLLGREQHPQEFLYWEFHGYGGQQAVRRGDWKGVRQNLLRRNRQPDLSIELYNLADDVGETRNVADEHQEVVAEIERIMREQHTPSEDFPIPALDKL